MLKIAHRINTVANLKEIPIDFGVEIDVRHDNRTNRLYLSHDPGLGEDLEEYLQQFQHRFVIFNIKEAGVEQRCIDLAAAYHIDKQNYFLLDVEFPYLYRASRQLGIREIAVRYSEAEPIEIALAQKKFLDWIWIDSNTRLPLNEVMIKKISGFKTCLVSPDRWGRAQDIPFYRKRMEELNFQLDAVMVGFEYSALWDKQ
jgi:hypothetical protein